MTDHIQHLARFDTPTVSDALDALGLPGAVTGITPMWDCQRIVGRVQTLQLGPAPEGPVASKRHLGASSLANSRPRDVIVVDNRAGQGVSAGWGGLLALAATLKQVAGVVVYGACRDIDDVAAVGLPLFAHGATPVTARSRTVEVSTNTPLVFGELTVSAGDLVIADRSGVVFVPQARAADVITTARAIFAKEEEMATQLRRGADVTDVLTGAYETMLTAAGKSGRGAGRSRTARS
ncbi:4-carboxy-4-hydroxy-2-oxoadipate aldolase/oxaloacetate decarboxylase [Streptomyces sp. NPDC006872]|uniref:RraA family protein n=1 Tax=Streptomyces sp. NPDC006872 TaxID=3155720 RepID=UPI0033F375D5